MHDLAVTALVERARAGDAAAFDEAVAKLAGRLLLHLRRRAAQVVGADCDAEDLLQQTLVRAWQALGAFQHGGGEGFYRWLLAIADGIVADRRKYQDAKGRGAVRHVESGGARPPLDPASSVSKVLARREERARVERVLADLDPELRHIVEQHFLADRSMADLARELGTSKSVVWARLHRAMERLRGALEGSS